VVTQKRLAKQGQHKEAHMTISQKIRQYERLAELAEIDEQDELSQWLEELLSSQPDLVYAIERAENCDDDILNY